MLRQSAPISLFLSFAFCFSSLNAADIETRSKIDQVTLFPDRAEITRLVQFEFPAGRNRLIVDQLPESILPQSLQLVPKGADDGAQFGQVSLVTRPLAGPSDEQVQAILEEILDLERKQSKEHDAIAAEEAKLTFIRGISESLGNDEADKLRRGDIDTKELLDLFSLVREQSYEALNEITSSRARIEELAEMILYKRRQLEELDSGGLSQMVAAIDIAAESEGRGELALVYQVRGGAWRPLIDARLDTAQESLQWTQLAMVNQRTGENWDDVELVLSTSQPVMGELPDLESWVIDVQPPFEPLVQSEAYAPRPANMAARSLAKEEVLADAVESRASAVVVDTGLDTRFVAAGRVSIPSGGSEHQVLIGDFPQSVEIGRKAVPRYQATAYVTAKFELAVPGPVPPAELRLYRDGGYIGSNRQSTLTPGSELELEFGRDDRIEVEYRLDRDQRSTEGIVTDYRRFARNYEIVVTNRHDEPVDISIYDQHPVPRDERIEVEISNSTSEPTRRDVDGRDGVLAWDLKLAPDASRAILFGYSVVHPSDIEITNF